jgi:hypothetical protein
MPVERVRGERPDDPEWRADALAGSRHTRLADELREPDEDHDPERSRALCAEITRQALLDFAPALIPLPPSERERAQALAAFSLTLFDFALQTGLEGERLAQINRWEFNLELALEHRPPGQPVFVQMARADESRPWPRDGLDGLVAVARRRAARPHGSLETDPEGGRGERERLAAALFTALLGAEPDAAERELGEAVLGVRALQGLGERLRRGRTGGDHLAQRIPAEAARLRALLSPAGRAPAFREPYRRSGVYLRRAALKILALVERRGEAIVDQPPRLGALARIATLLQARIARS